MQLRELKKEVQGLPNIAKTVQKLQDHWIKPLRSNSNAHLPFLQKLPEQDKSRLHRSLVAAYEQLHWFRRSQIQEKLSAQARLLIDLKLAALSNDRYKSQFLTKKLLQDDFYSMKQLIQDVQTFDQQLRSFVSHYHHINDSLHDIITLEETVHFMDLPHQEHLRELQRTAQKQRRLIKEIGQELVVLARIR